jgi:hypothetical protein
VGIVDGTREDVLPHWSGWRKWMAALRLPEVGTSQDLDDGRFQATVLDGTARQAFDAVTDALSAGTSPHRIAASLCGAAAERLLRFDDRIDRDLSVQDTWLGATHVQTFASAVRVALHRTQDLRLLYQAARMIQMTRPLDLPEAERHDRTPEPGDVLQAMASKDPGLALRRAAHALPPREDLEDLAVRDPAVRPIVVTHAIKQTVAAYDDYEACGDPRSVLAVVRLLSSPISERRVLRFTQEAIAFVTESKVPKTLVP